MAPTLKAVANLGSVCENGCGWRARVKMQGRYTDGPQRATHAEAQADLDKARECSSRTNMKVFLASFAKRERLASTVAEGTNAIPSGITRLAKNDDVDKSMTGYLRKLHQSASQAWPGLKLDRFCLLALYFPVKNCMSMLRARSADKMPESLLQTLEDLGLHSALDQKDVSWGQWFWQNLPKSSQRLYNLDDSLGCQLLDFLKFNKQPTMLNPTDLLILSVVMHHESTWQDVLTMSISARRCLNEAFHLLVFFTLVFLLDQQKLGVQDTSSDGVRRIITNGFVGKGQIVKVLRGPLLKRKDLVEKALALTIQIAGRNPRTGYRCLPIENGEKGTKVTDAYVHYLFGNFNDWLTECRSLRHAVANLPFRTEGGFQQYQVELDLQLFFIFRLRQPMKVSRGHTAGPGMVPYALSMSGQKLQIYACGCSSSEAKTDCARNLCGEHSAKRKRDACINKALDPFTLLRPAKCTRKAQHTDFNAYCTERRAGKRTKAGSDREKRVAADVVTHVADVLADDPMNTTFFDCAFNLQRIQGCRDADLVNAVEARIRGYDSLEYSCCELDRSLHYPLPYEQKFDEAVDATLIALFHDYVQRLRGEQIQYLGKLMSKSKGLFV